MAGSIYLAMSGLHRRWRGRKPPKSLPILVIGSLRAGGGGKTSVVEWFAARMPDAAILVHPTPDEQLLLEKRFPGRVYASRSFPLAWEMARKAGFSRAITDGGYQDPRLDGGVRVLLWDEDPPRTADRMIPYGPWRELADASARADHILIRQGIERTALAGTARPYRWECEVPEGIGHGPVLLACGVGNPERVRADLQAAGVQIQAEHVVPDHGDFDPEEILRLEARFPGLPWIGTEKDGPRWRSSKQPLHLLRRFWVPEVEEELLRLVQSGLTSRSSLE